MVLLLNVLFDHIVCNITTATAEISTRPNMPPPILFSQMPKFSQQLMRCLPLYLLYQTTYGHLGGQGYENVNMVWRNMPFEYFYLFCPAYLPDQIPQTKGHIPLQNWFPVLGNPDQMQVDHEYCMGTMPIFCHASMIPKNC